MISLRYDEFFLLILLLWMGHIALLWFREWRRTRKNHWQLSSNALFHCNNCHHSFVPKQPVSLCRCPRCNTVCIRHHSGGVARFDTAKQERKS